jgi:hypothetical protein
MEMENSAANAATFSRDPTKSPLSDKGEQSRGLHIWPNSTGSSGHYVSRTRRKPAHDDGRKRRESTSRRAKLVDTRTKLSSADPERVCCLLVLNSVTSTPQWIRQPEAARVCVWCLCAWCLRVSMCLCSDILGSLSL